MNKRTANQDEINARLKRFANTGSGQSDAGELSTSISSSTATTTTAELELLKQKNIDPSTFYELPQSIKDEILSDPSNASNNADNNNNNNNKQQATNN